MPGRGTNGSSVGALSAGACPTCGKPTMQQYRPFCSRRCADIDLHRWLVGAYAIPVKEDEDEDGTNPIAGAPDATEEPDEH